MPQRPKFKRPAPASARSSKRQKLDSSTVASKGAQQKAHKGKKQASEKTIIDIPFKDEDVELSDEDLQMISEFGGALSFLEDLNQRDISRSKKEIERLHSLNKPIRVSCKDDDLPSVDSSLSASDDSDSESDSQNFSDFSGVDGVESSESESDKMSRSDQEMPYEQAPRKKQTYWESDTDKTIPRLPIKLPDGRIQEVQGRVKMPAAGQVSDDPTEAGETDDSDHERGTGNARGQVEDVATGARFGRPAVIDVVQAKSRTARIEAAKEQIAGICQDIIADPENSLGLLRRLHTFSLPEITTPTHPDPVPNDPVIRRLAILSQLAVFLDIIPGYRIRALTEKEKAEKVSQMVARTRDWEQGLVLVYQNYLRGLEAELKARSQLADTALQCMCTLLSERTHFNFRVNLINCIVARLSKKNLDQSARLCLETIITVFRTDTTGQQSLEVVQVLNRMIKERHFGVHPDVLSCLLHLRLKTELDVRSSDTKSEKNTASNGKPNKQGKGKNREQPHLSKAARKALKEKQEIQREFREAEAEVDKEERARIQTETLKLLFVLYFSILKNPNPTPLVPAALHGISKFAHLVNIDFFKDLMNVLKNLIEMYAMDETVPEDSPQMTRDIQHRLLCIVTAFELLSGQGEALNIELSEFVTQLYKLIPPLSHLPGIDLSPPPSGDRETSTTNTMTSSRNKSAPPQRQSPIQPQHPTVADMLFRALDIVFSPRTFGTAAPPWCSAAFCKRLLIASLHWPAGVTLRTLDFVGGLIAKSPKLEAMLSTEDRSFDGVYRPDVDDPQVANPFGSMFWELHVLARQHWHPQVREEAYRLLNHTRS
ncbi:hypothetical protein AX16_003634 [Volvariella volvacea WC 439]|nr:hypothetical protein AX16_003634 [Volvariella volvacea WC 439]